MNAALAKLVLAAPFGFITEAQLPQVINADRLCLLLVRCGQCRFMAPAQDVAFLLTCIEAGGDYRRDVSFPSSVIDQAKNWPELAAKVTPAALPDDECGNGPPSSTRPTAGARSTASPAALTPTNQAEPRPGE